MPAVQPPEQPVRRVQRRLRVEIVEDQEPAGIGVQPGDRGLDLDLLVGGGVFGEAERAGQSGEAGLQPIRRLGFEQREGGVGVAMRPGIFHRRPRLADPAEAMDRPPGNGGGAAVGAGQAGPQAVEEVVAAFEQGAEGWVGEDDGFRDAFVVQQFFQRLGPVVAGIADRCPLQPERLDISHERRLQIGAVAVRRRFGVGFQRIRCEKDQAAPLEMAGEEEFPLGVGGLGDARRQAMAEGLGLPRLRKAGPGSAADQADDGAAALDIIGEFVQQGVRAAVMAEAALDPVRDVVRLQVARQRIPRGAELVRHGGEEDWEFGHWLRPG